MFAHLKCTTASIVVAIAYCVVIRFGCTHFSCIIAAATIDSCTRIDRLSAIHGNIGSPILDSIALNMCTVCKFPSAIWKFISITRSVHIAGDAQFTRFLIVHTQLLYKLVVVPTSAFITGVRCAIQFIINPSSDRFLGNLIDKEQLSSSTGPFCRYISCKAINIV